MTADFVIISSWPNGVYLSRKLSEASKKVYYIDIQHSPYRPMGVFLNEDTKGERRFLESLGTLEKQEGGFCLLSEQGVWHFQEDRGVNRLNNSDSFQFEWLSFFASGFMAPVFESNHQVFSQPLDLSSDYFLFQPHFKKKSQLQSADSNLHWFSLPGGHGLQLKEGKLLFLGKSVTLEKVIGIGGSASKIISPEISFLPEWEWISFDFLADLKEYEGIVPPHFVYVNRLCFPWTHDNLLSVFHNRGMFHVWCRQPLGVWDGEDEEELILNIQAHLQKVFPEVPFQFLKKGLSSDLVVYGQKDFSRLEEVSLLQGNFMEQLKNEEKIFHEVIQ
ncbi:MAG: hypothetical protein OXB86_00775 [Bdellovibrionales bacterium]|nr:hypothetical protein [Bdellovibrionales bacterium]